ncbi:MAG: phosphoribosyl-ATP diphosphatase [Planctomycetota bacterium]
MIVPSIDLEGGRAVQLRGGEELVIDAGDPVPIAGRFGLVGEIAVIDLDAAKGEGSNRELIERLCGIARCRVGGGIRDAETARRWLDAGAHQVILGTSAVPEVLQELPSERVIAAVDARDGEVVTHGWRTKTGDRLEDRIEALRDYVGGFLVTFVEREGRLGGTDLERVRTLVEIAGDAELTIAGGVTTGQEIAELDRLGCDAQVGMAIYNGSLPLADAFAAPLVTDRPDGLFPTVVCDERGAALGLAYSSRDTLTRAIEDRRGVYHSRSRGGLWIKGETSGDTQELLRVDLDCDRDAIRFTVRQRGRGFCHEGTRACWDRRTWGEAGGLGALDRTLEARQRTAEPGSYTQRLFSDPDLLRSKLTEEANELAEAPTAEEAAWEAADVIYFTLVAARARGATLSDVERELDRRALKVSRRPGNAKAPSRGRENA